MRRYDLVVPSNMNRFYQNTIDIAHNQAFNDAVGGKVASGFLAVELAWQELFQIWLPARMFAGVSGQYTFLLPIFVDTPYSVVAKWEESNFLRSTEGVISNEKGEIAIRFYGRHRMQRP